MGLRRGGGDRDAKPGLPGRQAEDNSPDRYKMREQSSTIGDDFWIETMRGRRAFKVDGKALRLRNTLILERAARPGSLSYSGQGARDQGHDGRVRAAWAEVATVKHALVSPLRDRMTANMAEGPDIEIRGNILNHEYTMERRGQAGGRGLQEMDRHSRHLHRGSCGR